MKFECIYILKEKATQEEINEITKIIQEKATIESLEKVGVKQLAYEIHENKTGFYVIVYFSTTNEKRLEIQEQLKQLRNNKKILKFIIVEDK